MTKITLDLEDLKQQRKQHQTAIERLDWMIENFFNTQEIPLSEQSVDDIIPTFGISRMRNALKVCEDYLKAGNQIRTMNEFMKLIEKNQIKLSRAGLGLALKKPYSNIVFDKDAREWKLKNQ